MEFLFDLWVRAGAGLVYEGNERVINDAGFRVTPMHFDGYTQRYTFVHEGRTCSIHRTYATVVRHS